MIRAPYATKMRIHNIAMKAEREGQIHRKACERCGADPALSLKHHEDYSKPFEITWICPLCHAVRHKELRRIHGVVIKGTGANRRYIWPRRKAA